MTTEHFFVALQDSAPGLMIAESSWIFPTVESLHVVALTLVFGTIVTVDLRLLGWASRDRSVTALTDEVLPWTWAGFILAAVTGLVMFISRADSYVQNAPFLWKMGLLVLAGANMVIFHRLAFRKVHEWDEDASQLPAGARAAGAVSLTLWTTIVFLGRWIGFV